MNDVLGQAIKAGDFVTYPFHGARKSITVRVGIVIRTTEKRVVLRRAGSPKNTTVQFPERVTVVDPVTVPADTTNELLGVYNADRATGT